MNDQHRWTTDDDDSRRRRIRQEDQDLWLERRRMNHGFEREMKELEHQHLERIEEIKLEIEQIKAQSTNDDKAGEREYQLDLRELEGLVERRKLRLTQPHEMQKSVGTSLQEMLKLQHQWAAAEDRTDEQKELDDILSSMIEAYRTVATMPLIFDADGNVDTTAMNRLYVGITDAAWKFADVRINRTKKDLAG